LRIAVIADDLTGALDTGVQFRTWGLSVEVAPTLDQLARLKGSSDVIVVNTDSRYDSPMRAFRKVKEASEWLSERCDVFYKKVDSTLRGNIGAELEAVMEAVGASVVAVAPAYPLNGRVTRGGHAVVNGVPLNETEYASEVKVPSSYVPEIIGAQTSRKATHIELQDVRNPPSLLKEFKARQRDGYSLIVLDAEGERDLLAVAGLPVKVFCGSAGLASELPEGLGLRAPGPTITVCGSARSSSRAQVARLVDRLGVTQVNLNTVGLLRGEEATADALARASRALSLGMDIALVSAPDSKQVEETRKVGLSLGLDTGEVENRVVDAISDISIKLLKGHKVRGVVLTGGATALAVCRGLGVESLEIMGEVQPGVPVLALPNDVRAVTKAGGFGSEEALIEAVKYLKRVTV